MSEAETPSSWSLVAPNEGHREPLPVVADSYWQDISLQAAARLARLEQRAADNEIEHPDIEQRFAPRARRLVLMVAVGTGLYASITYLLLDELRLPTVSAQVVPIEPLPR